MPNGLPRSQGNGPRPHKVVDCCQSVDLQMPWMWALVCASFFKQSAGNQEDDDTIEMPTCPFHFPSSPDRNGRESKDCLSQERVAQEGRRKTNDDSAQLTRTYCSVANPLPPKARRAHQSHHKCEETMYNNPTMNLPWLGCNLFSSFYGLLLN